MRRTLFTFGSDHMRSSVKSEGQIISGPKHSTKLFKNDVIEKTVNVTPIFNGDSRSPFCGAAYTWTNISVTCTLVRKAFDNCIKGNKSH